MYKFVVAAFIACLGVGCSRWGGATREDGPATVPLTVHLVYRRVDQLEGKSVELRGRFRGRRGSCSGPPPVSQLDWMLEDATGCIYVYGLLPVELDIDRPRDEWIAVRGWVLRRAGMVYLDGQRVRVLSRR